MKSRPSLAAAVSILILAMFACAPFQTPTSTPPFIPPAESLSTATLATPTSQPASTDTVTPTVEEATLPPPEITPLPAVPQPAAAAHFHPGDPVQIDFIHMASLTEGWGISGPYVLTTSDGGQTWREATPPDPFPSGPADKAYGAFLDAQTAWIVFSQDDHVLREASVWRTTDGGRTWTPSAQLLHQVIGDSVWAEFAMLDAQNVWLLVRGVYHAAGTHFNHELFRTADGGRTWTSLDGQISDDYTGMVFRDTLNGVRTLQTTGAYAAAPPAYEVTTDGGANWDTRELPPPTDAPDLFNQYSYCETYQPDLFSATFIRMLVGCFDYYHPPKKFVSYLYASFDDGKTWSIQLLPDKVLPSQDTLLFFGAYPALLLDRDMYQNSNGGFGDWPHVKTVNWDGQFSFVDPQNGWAVARSAGELALVQTTDGGGTWSVIKPVIAK